MTVLKPSKYIEKDITLFRQGRLDPNLQNTVSNFERSKRNFQSNVETCITYLVIAGLDLTVFSVQPQ